MGIVRQLVCASALALLAACGQRQAADRSGKLVLAQTPTRNVGRFMPADLLDLRYPPGSRVVVTTSSPQPDKVTVLSAGLHAAGGPVVSADGRRVLFAGKASPTNEWRLYDAAIAGGKPRALTSIEGGAMDPRSFRTSLKSSGCTGGQPGSAWTRASRSPTETTGSTTSSATKARV